MMITLEIEVQHVAGPFVSKDDIGEELASAVDTGSVMVEDSEYEVLDVQITTQGGSK